MAGPGEDHDDTSTVRNHDFDVDGTLATVPNLCRGPGGAVAILLKGEVVGRRTWGYADLDQRIPMTPRTQFPICSISKQMVCMVMVSLLRKPTSRMLERDEAPAEQLEAELRRLLPHLAKDKPGKGITVRDLCNMQSGIRDYWVMTTLWGARPEGPFSLLHDAPKALDRTKTFHFDPGTEYAYSNVNFHILGKIMENVSGVSLAQLLAERLFTPAGMSTAALCPNTCGLPLPIVGYEGNEKVGYFSATNRIEWAGDAGIAASLDDMIAYEQYLDRSISDPSSLYAHTSQQQTYSDGSPADYGYGLARVQIAGRTAICHGGALRGFRHNRLQIPSERLSVVVLLNHEATVVSVAERIVQQLLGWERPSTTIFNPTEGWKGDFLDSDTQLYITVKDGEREKPGTLSFRYGATEGTVRLTSETHAGSDSLKIRLEGDLLHVEMLPDHRTLRATRIQPLEDAEKSRPANADHAGRYRCDEVDSTFSITGEGGTLYGSFDGFLGRGPIWLMRQVGKDVWALGNPRGMDAGPPGDWTVVFERRKDDDKIQRCTVGCWLGRKVVYNRL